MHHYYHTHTHTHTHIQSWSHTAAWSDLWSSQHWHHAFRKLVTNAWRNEAWLKTFCFDERDFESSLLSKVGWSTERLAESFCIRKFKKYGVETAKLRQPSLLFSSLFLFIRSLMMSRSEDSVCSSSHGSALLNRIAHTVLIMAGRW